MEERKRKGSLDDDLIQDGPTCGVYSLAYALGKLGIEYEEDPMDWAIEVAFEGNVEKGCNPIKLTILAHQLISERFDVQFYADIGGLIECAESDTELVAVLSQLNEIANTNLGDKYIKSDYDYHNLGDGEVCIGIFAVGTFTKDDVKKEFLKQFKTNPANLHYMMIQKLGTKYCVYDSNVGMNIQIPIKGDHTDSIEVVKDEKVIFTEPYTYSRLAIVLSRK